MKTILSFLIFMSGFNLIAADTKPLMIDFDSFINLVDKNHPEKSITDLSLTRSQAAQHKAGNLIDPEISLGREKIPISSSRDIMKQTTESPMWQLTIKQMLPWPGTLSVEKNTAETTAKRMRSDVKLSALQRKIEAKNIFIMLVASHKVLEIEKENLKISDRILKNASARLKYDVGSHHELIQAQNEKIILNANIQADEADFANLRDYAAHLIGRNDASHIIFVYSLPENFTTFQQSFEDQTKNKLEDVKSEFSAKFETERKKSLPQFMIAGSLMREDTGMEQYSFMVGVSIPLYSHNIRLGIEKELQTSLQQSTEEIEWHEKKKILALAQLKRRKTVIESHLKSLKEELIPNLKQHLESLSSEYAQGKVDFNSINVARKSLLKYLKTQILAEKNLAMAAVSFEKIGHGLIDGELEQTTFQLPSSDMSDGNGMEMGSMNNMDSTPMLDTKARPIMKKSMKPMPMEEEQEKKSSMGGM